jgi:hypothetical protein
VLRPLENLVSEFASFGLARQGEEEYLDIATTRDSTDPLIQNLRVV